VRKTRNYSRALPLVGIVGVDPHCFFRIDSGSEQA
jgi:hypothetical protein